MLPELGSTWYFAYLILEMGCLKAFWARAVASVLNNWNQFKHQVFYFPFNIVKVIWYSILYINGLTYDWSAFFCVRMFHKIAYYEIEYRYVLLVEHFKLYTQSEFLKLTLTGLIQIKDTGLIVTTVSKNSIGYECARIIMYW